MITEKQAELIVERLVDRVEKANALFLKKIGADHISPDDVIMHPSLLK